VGHNVAGTKHLLRMQEKKGFRLIFFHRQRGTRLCKRTMSEDVMQTCLIQDTYQIND